MNTEFYLVMSSDYEFYRMDWEMTGWQEKFNKNCFYSNYKQAKSVCDMLKKVFGGEYYLLRCEVLQDGED